MFHTDRFKSLCALTLAAAALAGCADDSGSATDARTGRFLDSAVQGLTFETESIRGTTDELGAYSYRSGETVVFSIGAIELPSTNASEIVTALNIFNTDDVFDTSVVNLNRLLQSLDFNGDPSDGIDLTQLNVSATEGLNLNFGRPDFETQTVNLVANSGSVTTSLIPATDASAHFQETLQANGLGSSGCTSSHPLVGTSAEFTTRFHDVVGTVTVLDDCTLEVTNFGYDGLGPNVYFYTGLDGNFQGQNARRIGPQLNGKVYVNDVIRLQLPADLTLDDVNSLSVWCIDFRISFGDLILRS